MLLRIAPWLLTTATLLCQNPAKTLPLRFAWDHPADAIVVCTNTRGDRSFELTYTLEVTASENAPGELRVARRGVRVTKWNGEPVPDKHRNALRHTELQVEAMPDVRINERGECIGTEPTASWLRRADRLLRDAEEAGTLTTEQRAEMIASLRDPQRQKGLAQQAVQPWDDWVGRWLTRAFATEDETFEGEIELASGDVVNGNFIARIVEAPPAGDVTLRLSFRADGSKLDAAALRWRQRLFGGGDEAFEVVTMEVEETAEVVTDPTTMVLRRANTQRTTRVTVGKDTREFRESQTWDFRWQ